MAFRTGDQAGPGEDSTIRYQESNRQVDKAMQLAADRFGSRHFRHTVRYYVVKSEQNSPG
ncbi:MAG: hypothetical protein ACLSH6_05390 [Limosilactobacillus pontis]